ncbi:hypothetical protein PtB15_5B526 [Puccinia triticina]|nr:hypothetical protein PtB15_5B526 [Puccinia triticina]
MPFVNVAGDVNLFYEIKPTTSALQATTPWLLILHPQFLDISFVYPYVDGPGQLLERFNIILIDFRSHGRTQAKVSPSCDLWTLAADLAFALHKLNLPPRETPPSSLAPLLKAPMLVLHGDFQNIYDCPGAERRFNEFINLPPPSSFRVMKDTPLQMFDTFPERVKEQYYPWIDNLLAQQTIIPAEPSATISTLFNPSEALKLLAELLGDPSVASRDPHTSDSFYALSDEKISSNAERIRTLESNQISKFSILGGGAPESWTGASFEEQNPERFSKRIQKSAGEGGTSMVEEIILAITESTAEDDLL